MSGVHIRDLRVKRSDGAAFVHGLDADIKPGRTLAMIGESGSGKTLSAKALIGLLPQGFTAEGVLDVDGTSIPLNSSTSRWRRARGHLVALLMQDPFTSLSPVHRCGAQIGWTVEAAAGKRMSRAEIDAEVLRRLEEVNLPERAAAAYPHELSGGQRQRVAIAAALAADPRLLIADEPTTALDASNQGEILDLLRRLQQEREFSVILISHDLGLIRGRTDDVLVMRAGEIVEHGATGEVLSSPKHEYTRALLAADPSVGIPRRSSVVEQAPPLVVVEGLKKSFGSRQVLAGVDLRIAPGEVVGIVGESGSGKSTLARCIAGLEREDDGRVIFDGAVLPPGRQARTPEQMQMVFQDPYSSLNPTMTIGAILAEALHVVRRSRLDVDELLTTVGLPESFAQKRPAQLSGGQRQRVAIARALATRPRLLICDESVSALDVSVQAQILELIERLRDELDLAVLFISHDLAVVRRLADTVTVLWDGRVVESGPCDYVLTNPQNDYTRMLVAAAQREAAPPTDTRVLGANESLNSDIPLPSSSRQPSNQE